MNGKTIKKMYFTATACKIKNMINYFNSGHTKNSFLVYRIQIYMFFLNF